MLSLTPDREFGEQKNSGLVLETRTLEAGVDGQVPQPAKKVIGTERFIDHVIVGTDDRVLSQEFPRVARHVENL